MGFQQLQMQILAKWGLSQDMQEKIRGGSFFDVAQTADYYVFVSSPPPCPQKLCLSAFSYSSNDSPDRTRGSIKLDPNLQVRHLKHQLCVIEPSSFLLGGAVERS